ncbi:MAG: NAD-dependent epimerase/dehydratase family protein, partial [Cyclobacteriaceae bacterium]|nr:NAD-dependent epimerase/dehydratase family protein [Cyclobacteriaceae bacterium]
SARAESNPVSAWDINMKSLLNILSLAVELNIGKVFWPSSIAAFGPGSPKQNTPQNTVMDPSTVYGISKLAGERWLDYFNKKYGLDARSLRYPGIISYKTRPGGGTTDYAVDIFHKVVNGEDFECFLEDDTALPMMFIDDAVRATLELMDAPSENISIRSSYNVAAISFTPEELFWEIEKHINSFKISYKPDFRQKIADSWPDSIDDTIARKDWDWKPEYNLERMVKVMLENIKQLQQ